MTGEKHDGDQPSWHSLSDAAGATDEGMLIEALPFSREIGMRLHQAADSVALLSVPYDQSLVGDPGSGVLHGGVITALLDTACGWAVMASGANLRGTATLDLRIDYMRPARIDEKVFARAECYRLTRSVAFARAVAFHAEGEADPVATAQGAFMLERGKEAG